MRQIGTVLNVYTSVRTICILVVLSLTGFAEALCGQGITTSAIRVSVRTEDGTELNGVKVRVVNTATGVASTRQVQQGRILVQGLEVGGPYVVEVRHIGFVPQRSQPIYLTLGEPVELHIAMQRAAPLLDTVLVTASPAGALAHGGGGTVTTIPDELLHRLPTLDRNVFDFVRLAPQISTKVGTQRIGLSAVGENLRFNNFLINGADERAVNGNVSLGINGGKSIPIDAVKEYQVLVAPYDVRYGDFAGALVNTVTRSGTNDFHGSTFGFWRNDRLARGGELASSEPYDRLQSGFAFGGPIVHNRVHFFFAAEIQRLNTPAPGPYMGQSPSALTPLRVGETDVSRFGEILSGYSLSPGSAYAITNRSELRNIFARVDASFPKWNSRVVAFSSYAGSRIPQFTRIARDTFYLSSYKYAVSPWLRLTSVQLHTDFLQTLGGHNELILSHIDDGQDLLVDVRQPVVRVLVPATDGGLITLNSGTAEAAQGGERRNWSLTVKDELTFPIRSTQMVVVGFQAERYQIRRSGVPGAYGVWTFSSLDSLQRGIADRYELRKDFGSASAPLKGAQYAAYLSSDWSPTEHLSITTGIRADAWSFSSHAPFNEMVSSIFGRRTDELPRARIQWSPRAGFTWHIPGKEGDQLRGGLGAFVGRPPRAWIVTGVTSYGVGTAVLRCGSLSTDGGPPPDFVPDYQSAPSACRGSQPQQTAPLGDVDLIDRNLRMARTNRASIAYDRHVGWGTMVTTEAVANRNISDFVFVNLNLKGPQSSDMHGRVLYGTIAANGVATPALRSGFSEVIDLRNTSKNYSYQLTTRLEKRFTRGVAATASYTYSRVRDVQSPSRVNSTGIALWADARAISGRQDEMIAGTSLNDLPHRVVTAMTYTAPWRSASTELSFYYIGESGSPFTYTATGTSRRGDLNADGSNSNDPIYVPRDAADMSEIILSGRSDTPGADNSLAAQADRIVAQQAALERFIERSSCLKTQRGRIVERNSCREPWSHTTIAGVRQSLPFGERAVELELQVFNVLNLLSSRWGRYRVSSPRLLEQVGQTPSPVETAQPIFRFDSTRPEWTTLQTESAFQLQLGARYRF